MLVKWESVLPLWQPCCDEETIIEQEQVHFIYSRERLTVQLHNVPTVDQMAPSNISHLL